MVFGRIKFKVFVQLSNTVNPIRQLTLFAQCIADWEFGTIFFNAFDPILNFFAGFRYFFCRTSFKFGNASFKLADFRAV